MKRHTEMRLKVDEPDDVEGNVKNIFIWYRLEKKKLMKVFFCFLLLEPKLTKLFKYICKYLFQFLIN